MFLIWSRIICNGNPLQYSCLENLMDGLQSMGSRRVDWVTSLSPFTFTHWRRKCQPTPVFLPGESRDGGAWWSMRFSRQEYWSGLPLQIILDQIKNIFYYEISLTWNKVFATKKKRERERNGGARRQASSVFFIRKMSVYVKELVIYSFSNLYWAATVDWVLGLWRPTGPDKDLPQGSSV